MSSYVFIETRDPFGSNDVVRRYELAEGLARRGHRVTMFLAQNAVLGARRTSTAAHRLASLASSNRVLADDFALRERAISEGELVARVAIADVGALVDLLVEPGCKPVWQ